MVLRVVGALAALVSAAIHFWEYFFNGYDQTGVGVPFLINGVAGVVIAVLLLTWQHWVPLLLLFGFGAVTFLAFVVTATVGLLGVKETWTGLAVWASLIVEALAVVVSVVAAVKERQRGVWASAR